MAFDGITIANIVKELQDTIVGGRLSKIAQPETDELLLTIKAPGTQKRLLISAGASLPLIYLTDQNKPSPMTAPNFCMLLRKHIQNGRILSISQPGLERIIRFEIEHLNEMGDLCRKFLVVELMGKHSNIIFCDDKEMIIDSIKHISGMVSSVREVLPGKSYFIPQTQDKLNPLDTDAKTFADAITGKPLATAKAIYTSYTGISPIIAQKLCYDANIDGDRSTAALSSDDVAALWNEFSKMITAINSGVFKPNIAYTGSAPVEFGALALTLYENEPDHLTFFNSMSELLEAYYAQKNTLTRIRQKSADLRKIVQTALERNVKKYDLQMRQMKDTEKRETYRIYGELLHTYGYSVPEGSKSCEVMNYYTNEMITIPLDDTLTPMQNAQKYYDKYGKMKRTFEALTTLTVQVKEEIEHLESISTALDIALLEEDLTQIKEELIETGYIRRKGNAKREKITSKPFHYISSDGYHMYVGKNNYQNEELTFKFATGNDWWFHAKDMPGSHVIVKTNGETDLPDATFEEAGKLAAYYSKGRGPQKVEIDYTLKKNVKKPSGGKPGFVVYYTNYSLLTDSDIEGIEMV